MSQSQRLPMRDLEAAYRIVREACELGGDAVAWRLHMLDRLDPLVRAQTSMLFVSHLPFDPARIQMPVFVGKRLDPHWLRYRDCSDVRPDPCTRWIAPRLASGFSEVRQRMCDDATWYGSEYFNEVLRPIRQDHYLVSVIALPEQGVFSTIGLTGCLGDSPFCARTQKLVHLLHNELATLWRTPPLSQPPEWRKTLNPRLAQVLEGLVEGLSEKQVALRLSLGRPTVHNYITRLHKLLGVTSRGELLAKARPPVEFRPRLIPSGPTPP